MGDISENTEGGLQESILQSQRETARLARVEAALTEVLDPILGEALSAAKHPEARAEYQRIVQVLGGVPTTSELLTHSMRRVVMLRYTLQALEAVYIATENIAVQTWMKSFWLDQQGVGLRPRIELLSEVGRGVVHKALEMSLLDYRNEAHILPVGLISDALLAEPKGSVLRSLYSEWVQGVMEQRERPAGLYEQLQRVIETVTLLEIDRAQLIAELVKTERVFRSFPFRSVHVREAVILDPLIAYLGLAKTDPVFIRGKGASTELTQIRTAVYELSSCPSAIVCTEAEHAFNQAGESRLMELDKQGKGAEGPLFSDGELGVFGSKDLQQRESLFRVLVDQLNLPVWRSADLVVRRVIVSGTDSAPGYHWLYRTSSSPERTVMVVRPDEPVGRLSVRVFIGDFDAAKDWLCAHRGPVLGEESGSELPSRALVPLQIGENNPFGVYLDGIQAHLELRRAITMALMTA